MLLELVGPNVYWRQTGHTLEQNDVPSPDRRLGLRPNSPHLCDIPPRRQLQDVPLTISKDHLQDRSLIPGVLPFPDGYNVWTFHFEHRHQYIHLQASFRSRGLAHFDQGFYQPQSVEIEGEMGEPSDGRGVRVLVGRRFLCFFRLGIPRIGRRSYGLGLWTM